MIRLNSIEEIDRFVKANDNCILKYMSPTCSPCRAYNVVLKQVHVPMAEINVAEMDAPDEIRTVPALRFFSQGEYKKTLSGVHPLAEILAHI
jgi:hypothetical protein